MADFIGPTSSGAIWSRIASRTVSGARMRAPSSVPAFSHIRQKRK